VGLSDSELVAVLHETATAVGLALDGLQDWGLVGTSDSQYRHDLVADQAALEVLTAAGLGVVSEESGSRDLDAGVVVVVDPVDGSTNASRGLPWWNTSLCALDADGLRAAVVVNQPAGIRYEAIRGGGARVDGQPLAPSRCEALREALVGLNGYPHRHLGWKQFRALGATALDLCAVAAGVLDGYVDCSYHGAGPWDYLGGVLVCLEAGAAVADARGNDLVTWSFEARRTPVAAGTQALLDELLAARATFP
jgi:myo-inositol-1(or 4)-monophosphatase